jgi:hypothetical protein
MSRLQRAQKIQQGFEWATSVPAWHGQSHSSSSFRLFFGFTMDATQTPPFLVLLIGYNGGNRKSKGEKIKTPFRGSLFFWFIFGVVPGFAFMLDMEPRVDLDDKLLAMFALPAWRIAGNKVRPLRSLFVARALAIFPPFLGVALLKTHGQCSFRWFFIVNPRSGRKASSMRFIAQ